MLRRIAWWVPQVSASERLRRRLQHTLAEAMGETAMPEPMMHADRVVELCEQAVRDARDWRHELTTNTTTEETPDDQ